jgi:putative (di)nucleoside polyphosphate hydrolase
MLINSKRRVFVAKRIDFPGDAWQMPQGGLEDGEEPAQTVLRELTEETGTNKADIITESIHWRNYDLPDELIGLIWGGKFRGQRQKWFLLRFTGDDRDIDLCAHGEPEFSAWKWAEIDEIVDLIVPFKRALYADIVSEFRPFIEGSK